MQQVILIIHIFTAVCLIGLVLIQQGRGATTGAAFGSGASQTVFGSRGTASFLVKLTAAFALVFFSTSLLLTRLAATPQTVSVSQQDLPIAESQADSAPADAASKPQKP